MLKRAAPALTVQVLMLLLVATEVRPPRWMTTPPVEAAFTAPAVPLVLSPNPPEVKREIPKIPKILAVDERIKKRLSQLQPAVKKRLAHVARRLPKRVKLLVTSAYRTRQEQARLRPTFGVKARPGYSPHEDGRAIDLNVLVDGKRIPPRRNKAVIGKIMAEAGFKYLGHHDPVHFSVPKWEIGVPTVSPDLEVMTMDEVLEIRELEAAAEQSPAFTEPAPVLAAETSLLQP